MNKEYFIEKNGRKIYVKEAFPDAPAHPVPTVIFSHGFNGCHEDFEKECTALNENGIGAFCFDFCGGSTRSRSGLKTRQMTLLTEKEDLEAVLSHAEEHPLVDRAEIFLFGASQGGMVSALLAEEAAERIAGLALLYPALCIPDDWRKKVDELGYVPETFDLWGVILGKEFYHTVSDWDIFEKLGRYGKRILLMHGDQDAVVPVEYVRKAADLYPLARYKEFPGEGHGFSAEGTETVVRDLIRFVKEKEELRVHVRVTEAFGVENGDEKIQMILFDGEAEGEQFHGRIMPGAVDTQHIGGSGAGLSARYMIKGEDSEGEACSLYVDNAGTFSSHGVIATRAHIVTDCAALKHLNHQELSGLIENTADETGSAGGTGSADRTGSAEWGLCIHLYGISCP